jgi:hypothetical protein
VDYQQEYNQMMHEGGKNQERFRYLTIGVIAFVLGFGIAWVSFKNQDGANVAMDSGDTDENRVEAVIEDTDGGLVMDDDSDSPTSSIALSGVSLSVLDQAPGKSVFVEEVTSQNQVWVVIVEDNDGAKGNILGAGHFDPEDKAGIVKLLRGTVEGGSYYALLYFEDSNLETGRSFDLEKDLPLVDSTGNAIEVRFNTSSSPE